MTGRLLVGLTAPAYGDALANLPQHSSLTFALHLDRGASSLPFVNQLYVKTWLED